MGDFMLNICLQVENYSRTLVLADPRVYLSCAASKPSNKKRLEDLSNKTIDNDIGPRYM